MKVLLGAMAFIALSVGVADAATISVGGVFNPNALLSWAKATVTAVVPEPSTWGLMIFGFGLLGHKVRAKRKVKA